ncbi:hypothetical protein L228DRAFT_257917 [Xylona heveae TC161]|uniref:Luciferase domain-containing protein n=1 Tax=Xylona heveae (strain CBS 132557 / TC161) TaxID=1328760 RepID=A0A165JPP8_XYLHT|nr:hypothetical protein L228DRAFT_257917 [Xylona heveae TC161]KZF26491.1 hypothetical protein L228DRAFT_257917 [Xylona heveae TC161]
MIDWHFRHREGVGSLPGVDPIAFLAICLSLPVIYLIWTDYIAFVSLGPGGTSCNFLGYLKITFLRLFALRDPCVAAPVPANLEPQSGYLFSLPKRTGRRPSVTGIAPHRQTTHRGTQENFLHLSYAIRALSLQSRGTLGLGTSCFEKHGTGLFATTPLNRTCNGEICHAHPSDGSLHMTLHPADAKLIIENRWGERHPLAKGGWLSRFVPIGFVMVYAPRDKHELRIVMQIIKAAAWWVGGSQALKWKEVESEEGQVNDLVLRIADRDPREEKEETLPVELIQTKNSKSCKFGVADMTKVVHSG